jgi:hypothetical protein
MCVNAVGVKYVMQSVSFDIREVTAGNPALVVRQVTDIPVDWDNTVWYLYS